MFIYNIDDKSNFKLIDRKTLKEKLRNNLNLNSYIEADKIISWGKDEYKKKVTYYWENKNIGVIHSIKKEYTVVDDFISQIPLNYFIFSTNNKFICFDYYSLNQFYNVNKKEINCCLFLDQNKLLNMSIRSKIKIDEKYYEQLYSIKLSVDDDLSIIVKNTLVYNNDEEDDSLWDEWISCMDSPFYYNDQWDIICQTIFYIMKSKDHIEYRNSIPSEFDKYRQFEYMFFDRFKKIKILLDKLSQKLSKKNFSFDVTIDILSSNLKELLWKLVERKI